MFKFNFNAEDNQDAEVDESAGDSITWLPAQEHTIPTALSPDYQQDEVTSVEVCDDLILRLLNGERVTRRLEQRGAAGDLALTSRQHSDLVPGRYEGGMKLWECAWDLVRYIHHQRVPLQGRRVAELGCGAALPAIYCLKHQPAALLLQDYNREVIDHLTVPNLLLNFSAEELTACRLVSGDWGSVADLAVIRGHRADLVLTSETIYSRESCPRLLKAIDALLTEQGTALVAAKTYYFGVGGGTRDFEQLVRDQGIFNIRTVFTTEQGLQREILELTRKQVN